MKRIVICLTAIICLCSLCLPSLALNSEIKEKSSAESAISADFSLDCISAVLMEASTGTILYAQEPDKALPPASVTKVMTLLLVMEALDQERISLTDTVTVSANAASMGGSQVFLEEGERMSVEDLLKCTVIASANDAAVALAEYVAGSEEAFVSQMNTRASQLGLSSTTFENVTGLDDTVTHHLTSAQDIAVMSRELLKYPLLFEYSRLWQDTIRGGAFTLTNTNRLVRYYDGCTGLKTGSTDAAGFCVSVTATRDNMTLIAVIMGAPTRDVRNDIARTLLDYGFSNYALYECPEKTVENTPVRAGKVLTVPVKSPSFFCVIPKGSKGKIEEVFDLPDYVQAPMQQGDIVGKKTYRLGGDVIGESDIYIGETIDKLTFFHVFLHYLASAVGSGS